ncbi:MAG: FAD-dependent oxidoreductase [Actinomycetota bacterium]|nr:FAD-dependent oxidoreductase [Actinomycetota bacterium]
MTIYGPPWESVARPRLVPSSSKVDVAVVGAGITGLTLAVELSRAGASVGVVESRYVGAGTTGASTAKVSVLQGGRFGQLALHGHPEEVLRAYAEAQSAGREWVRRETHGADRIAQPATAVTYATTAAGAGRLRREAEVMEQAGIVVDTSGAESLPVETTASIALADQLRIDPRRYLALLVDRLLASPSCWVWESARVIEVDEGHPCGITVDSDPGTAGAESRRMLEADRVVVATGIPMLDRGGFFARLVPQRSYCIAVELEEEPPPQLSLSIDGPTRSLRPGGHPIQLVVAGNGHVTGRGGSVQQRYDDLERWTRQHFAVRRLTHRWSAQDYQPANGLPYVGALRPRSSRLYTATGFNKWGLTGGTAAAQALARVLTGSGSVPAGWDPWHLPSPQEAASVASLNAKVGGHLAVGWAKAVVPPLPRPGRTPPPSPEEGRAHVRSTRRGPVGTSCVDGTVRSVSVVCPHLGGILSWNDGDKSWDCPLHGSRFAPDGSWLYGPAVRDLEPRDGG